MPGCSDDENTNPPNQNRKERPFPNAAMRPGPPRPQSSTDTSPLARLLEPTQETSQRHRQRTDTTNRTLEVFCIARRHPDKKTRRRGRRRRKIATQKNTTLEKIEGWPPRTNFLDQLLSTDTSIATTNLAWGPCECARLVCLHTRQEMEDLEQSLKKALGGGHRRGSARAEGDRWGERARGQGHSIKRSEAACEAKNAHG